MRRYIMIFAMALALTGCNKWLDVRPQNEQSNQDFWNNKEEVKAVVIGSYSQLRNCLEFMVKWGEVRGDVVDLGPGLTSNQEMLNVKSIEIKPDNSICQWRTFYNAINRANSVIAYAGSVLEKDDTFSKESCDTYIAEAKWIRTLCYFYLVRTFRDVPYVTTPYLDDQTKFEVPKTDGMEVLRLIADDLLASLDKLPIAYEVGSWENKGRATIWAAYALLADIYLWLEDYENAISMCSKLETSHLYSLVPNESWYTIFYPGNTDESIFELQWSSALEQTNNLFGWFYNDSDSNNYAVSESAIAKFTEIEGETDIRGNGGSFITASSKIWKYAGTDVGVDNIRESANRDANWIIYRFADILLMHAEALIMRGGADDYAAAWQYVVKVRERAGYLVHPDVPVEKSVALDMVMDERMRELCFEGKRWFDLVRMATRNDGEYKSRLISLLLLNVAAKDRPLYESKLQNTYGYFLPINETDMDASGGVLIQNPYYL